MSLPICKIGSSNDTPLGFGMMGIVAYYATTIGEEERFKVRAMLPLFHSIVSNNHYLLPHTALRRGIRERVHHLGHR